jgi:hypothetical protein
MEFKNKITKDLYYSITSEYVLNDKLALPYSFLKIDEVLFIEWLKQIDNSPQQLIDFIEKHHSRRLGRYFENLLYYYFLFHPNIEVLEFGKQIFRGKTTIGEMDFILKNKTTDEIIHLETAVKYFAKVLGKPDFKNFICPNGNRNLGDKLNKTFDKQLRITEREETKFFLKQKRYLPIKSYHFIKGILFYHPKEIKNFYHPDLNPKHNKSWWIYKKEISTLNNFSKFKIVHKLKWLSEEVEENENKLLSKKELAELLNKHFEIISQGQLIVEFKKSKSIWKEKSRGFILDDKWPLVDNTNNTMK